MTIPIDSSAAQSNSPISLVSWNIQVGSDSPLFGNNWLKRKHALLQQLCSANPDILCVQEGLIEQLHFLEQEQPGYERIGVGRDDGKSRGEHCAIFYRSNKLTPKQFGTFWLSDTPNSSEHTWDGIFKRICTWTRFSETTTGKEFCVFNTHSPLNPFVQSKSAKLLVTQIKAICPNCKTILVGDFNSTPTSAPWTIFRQSGLTNAESVMQRNAPLSPTCHLLGHPLTCIDAVFVSKGITVQQHRVLNDPTNGVYPSDHFGTLVNFRLD